MFRLLFLFILLHCNDIKRPPLYSLLFPSLASSETIAVISSDFGSSGRFTTLNQDVLLATPTSVAVHSDAIATYQNGLVYIVNRLGRDNIQVLNPSLGFLTILEFSVGAGSNPQDIIVVNSTKAYVSLYSKNYLLVVNPSSGVEIKRIDLSKFSETITNSSSGLDGNPEAHRMYLYENKLYLQLQRLDRNDSSGFPAPTDFSYLLEFDTLNDSLIGAYRTPSSNPLGKMHKVDLNGVPHLLMCLPARLGFLSKLDGGVYAFNLLNKKFLPNPIYSEQIAKGDILDIVIKPNEFGYAYVLDPSFNKSIQKFSLSTGQKISELGFFSATAGNIGGLGISTSGKFFVGDANFSKPGVSVFDVNTDQRLTPISIDVGLRPTQILIY
ncbi:MAG: hypothetical protein SFU98_14405 [Leptospiraceae bacterium]|nr:hypothetical protein [Leptospiraceae bacterium]